VFPINYIIKNTKISFHVLGTCLILLITSTLILNINIEKSFAVEKATLLPLNSANPKLNTDMSHFYNCISKSAKTGDSLHLPKFFKNEPTKTEIALCFKEMKASKSNIK
jgi:hypothetical protein